MFLTGEHPRLGVPLVSNDSVFENTPGIRSTNAERFPEPAVKVVSENVSALRFGYHGFESG